MPLSFSIISKSYPYGIPLTLAILSMPILGRHLANMPQSFLPSPGKETLLKCLHTQKLMPKPLKALPCKRHRQIEKKRSIGILSPRNQCRSTFLKAHISTSESASARLCARHGETKGFTVEQNKTFSWGLWKRTSKRSLIVRKSIGPGWQISSPLQRRFSVLR